MLSLSMLFIRLFFFLILGVSGHRVPRERYQQISTKEPHLARVCIHLHFQVGSVFRKAVMRAKSQTFTFKMLSNTFTPSSCSRKPLIYSFKSKACSLNHNNRLLIGKRISEVVFQSKGKQKWREVQPAPPCFFFFFLGIRIAFPGPPQEGTAIVPWVHSRNPSQCVRKEGEAADQGDARPLQGEPLSVKCHPEPAPAAPLRPERHWPPFTWQGIPSKR